MTEKINVKGVSVWDGETFQTIQNDYFVDEAELENWIKYSENVFNHAVKSLASLKEALGRSPS